MALYWLVRPPPPKINPFVCSSLQTKCFANTSFVCSYLAYLAFEFPFGWLMQKYPLDRVLAYIVTGWGICVLSLAACNNFTQR